MSGSVVKIFVVLLNFFQIFLYPLCSPLILTFNIDSFLLIWVLFQYFQEDTCFELQIYHHSEIALLLTFL